MSEESVRKLRETNIAKYGSHEAWVEIMRERGREGGKVKKTTHLSNNPKKAQEIGRLGAIARWKYKKTSEDITKEIGNA